MRAWLANEEPAECIPGVELRLPNEEPTDGPPFAASKAAL